MVKREGYLVPFRIERIRRALELAFRDTKAIPKEDPFPTAYEQALQENVRAVAREVLQLAFNGSSLTVEAIQDCVEVVLMRNGHHDVARDYIIYRNQHKSLREDFLNDLWLVSSHRGKVRFKPMKLMASIQEAFQKAFPNREVISQEEGEAMNQVIRSILQWVREQAVSSPLSVRQLGDRVERELMKEGLYEPMKQYILLRLERKEQSPFFIVQSKKKKKGTEKRQVLIARADGSQFFLKREQVEREIAFACRGLEERVATKELLKIVLSHLYEGMKEEELATAAIMAARSQIEREPAYSKVAARFLYDKLLCESLGVSAQDPHLESVQAEYFLEYVSSFVAKERLDARLLEFNLERLSRALRLDRDEQWNYLGLQTLYDRYFLCEEERRIETPQIFWMRVAMGLALNEGKEKTSYAMQFYELLSSFSFVSSTPTLFNAATNHPQLSSCYLSTVDDDLKHIFKVISDNAMLSKWAGGIGNDWTRVRGMGALIRGTNGASQGLIPFLKVANDTAIAVNQGGKRKGAVCAYLESWHIDIEDFLELRKNTGDDRRRTHDMHTANWIPDLFMKRLSAEESWTLFSPDEVPDLHDLYGKAFEERYVAYEREAREGKMRIFKEVEAVKLWRKMLEMLFETGHPWITFKDPSNIRSMQDHMGVVHNSNLCTEILLNNSNEETAVCNLGSINLAAHITPSGIDEKRLAQTVQIAVRMLDNVIDLNFYPTKEAEYANRRDRPIGLGLMGFQDALYLQNISYASEQAVEFADRSMEMISYYAILASSFLARERGSYASYSGSKWERGLLPLDTLEELGKLRGEELTCDQTSQMDWEEVRRTIGEYGMRNSHTLAIAPTATISNIVGISQSIEPMYKHLFVHSNLSGGFTSVNEHLVEALRAKNLWNEEMLEDLKYFDGRLDEIERIPQEIQRTFPTAFEIDPKWLIECASRRQKWIDMGQSLNLYLKKPNGKQLDQMYRDCWRHGLKTTYYLRCEAATAIEPSTVDVNSEKRSLQPRWMKHASPSSRVVINRSSTAQHCSLGEECESCQ